MSFANLPRTPLGKIGSVDMLSLLENRLISDGSYFFPSTGVDTLEDLKRAEDFYEKRFSALKLCVEGGVNMLCIEALGKRGR